MRQCVQKTVMPLFLTHRRTKCRDAVLKAPAGPQLLGACSFPEHFVHIFCPGNFQRMEGHLLLILNPHPQPHTPFLLSALGINTFVGLFCEPVVLIIALEKWMRISPRGPSVKVSFVEGLFVHLPACQQSLGTSQVSLTLNGRAGKDPTPG